MATFESQPHSGEFFATPDVITDELLTQLLAEFQPSGKSRRDLLQYKNWILENEELVKDADLKIGDEEDLQIMQTTQIEFLAELNRQLIQAKRERSFEFTPLLRKYLNDHAHIYGA